MGKFATTGLPCTHDASKTYQYIVCGLHKSQFDKLAQLYASVPKAIPNERTQPHSSAPRSELYVPYTATASTSSAASVADTSTTDTILDASTDVSTVDATIYASATIDSSTAVAKSGESTTIAGANESTAVASTIVASTGVAVVKVGGSIAPQGLSQQTSAGQLVLSEETSGAVILSTISSLWSRVGKLCMLGLCLLLITRYLGKKGV